MKKYLIFVFLSIIAMSCFAYAQDDYASLESRIRNLENKVNNLESKVTSQGFDMRNLRSSLDDAGIVLFFFAVFCALWAQNTNRNPWLWFFLGLFLHLFTAIALLYKNAVDKGVSNYFRRNRQP